MANTFNTKSGITLLAENSLTDQLLIKKVLEANKILNKLFIVENGVETLKYLRREGKYADPEISPKPDILLLNIKMPQMDGKAVLKEIRNDPALKSIPVVMMTMSHYEKDIIESCNLGVRAFITKPDSCDQFINAIHRLEHFWLHEIKLPSEKQNQLLKAFQTFFKGVKGVFAFLEAEYAASEKRKRMAKSFEAERARLLRIIGAQAIII